MIYKTEAREFEAKPAMNSDITVSLAYLYIGFSSLTNQSTQVWSYHHSAIWKEKELSLPQANWGKLVLDDPTIEGGDSIRSVQKDRKYILNWQGNL